MQVTVAQPTPTVDELRQDVAVCREAYARSAHYGTALALQKALDALEHHFDRVRGQLMLYVFHQQPYRHRIFERERVVSSAEG
jgi:hypothetical protein